MHTIDSPTAEELNALFVQACEDHQNKKFKDALEGYQKLVSFFPEAPILHYNLGLLLFELQEYGEALESFALAAKINPEDADIIFNLALSYRKRGDNRAAIQQYIRVLELEPSSLDALYNLAGCYRDEKHDELAITLYQKVLQGESRHIAASNNLAYVYQRQGETEKAVHYYKKVLELDPEHKAAGHMLSALTGSNVPSPPKGYVQEVFDNYSAHYEKHLVLELEYAVPEKIKNILCTCNSWKKEFTYGLDLGCGTGLGCVSFTGLIESVDGVDLAPKMIEIAREKDIYNSLHVSGINEFLVKNVGPYDFVLAADVFIYLGDLEETFLQLHGRTTADVLICFSTENTTGNGYELRQTGRYAHSETYIENLANKTGWKVSANHFSSLRKERGDWIEGNLWFMEKALS